jgi:pilus assembly protein FimV
MGRERRGPGEKKLEQYGVWVKAEPREVLEAHADDDSIELSDLDTPLDAGAELPDITDESPLTTEEEKLLDELETELEPAAADAKDLPELILEPSDEVEVALSDSLPAEEHFDDLQALEDELASVTSAGAAAGAPAAADGRSSEVLARIEDELRSIRTDLTELKKELAGLRAPLAPRRAPAAEPEGPAAFFDEDEDETIALTGDELDNILNTADITEGTAEAAAPDEEAASADSLRLDPLEVPAEAAAGPVDDDILSYETPILEEDRLAPLEAVEGDEELAELEPEPGGADLAADLVLETVTPSPTSAGSGAADALDDLDLEALPEIEGGDAMGEPVELEAAAELEPIELESADLEPVEDLEAEDLEAEEPGTASAGIEHPAGRIDLEALARETEEASDPAPLDLDTELDTAELEPVADDGAAGSAGIEIDFDAGKGPAGAGRAEPLDDLLEVEEIPDIDPAPAAAAPRPAPAASRESPRGTPKAAGSAAAPRQDTSSLPTVPDDLKEEIRNVLKYMDHLLEALPEDKVEEFAKSEYFAMYNKLFKELGLGE